MSSTQADDLAHREVLDNGLTVVHQAAHEAALVSVQLWVKTGSIHEGALLGCGLSHFLEHMLFKGTPTRGPLDIARQVQGVGGYLNAYTTFDRTVYYLDLPSEKAALGFDVLADMGFAATLPEAEFQQERDVILREIDMGNDDPDRCLFRDFIASAFRQHPYRYPVIGHRELFETITAAELRNYYEGRYTPDNAVLVVTGDLSWETTLELADKYFGGLPRRRLLPAPIAEEPPQLAPRQLTQHGDYGIVRGMVGYQVPGLAHADGPALDVLAQVAGHGQSARLWQQLREERGLVHQIDAACWNPGSHGLLWAGYSCDEAHADAIDEAIHETLQTLANEAPEEAAVARAVRHAVVSEINAAKTVGGRAARLGAAEVVAGDLGFPQQRLEHLRTVTPEAVQAAARTYLQVNRRTAASLRPARQSSVSLKQTEAGHLPEFQLETLPGGARLLWQQGGGVPKLHLRLLFFGGPAFEKPGQRGLVGVLSTLLTKDTARRSAAEVARTIEDLGGSLREHCGNNSFGLSLEVLPEDAATAIEVLRDAVTQPAFVEKTFQRELEAQLASLKEDDDEVLEFARRRLRARFFGQRAYACDYLGHADDLAALTVADIRKAFAQLVCAPNAVLAVAGQFDEHLVLPALRELLGALPSGEAPTLPSPMPIAETGLVELQRDCAQAVVLQAFADGGIRDEEYEASELLDELLSGMASRLFLRVRESQGLAYYVAAQRMVGLDHGMFTLYAGTQPDKVAQVQAEFAAETRRLCEGQFEPEEIAGAVRRLLIRKRSSRQSPGGRATEAALDVLYGRGLEAGPRYAERLQAITPERLSARARQLFQPTQNLQLVVRPN